MPRLRPWTLGVALSVACGGSTPSAPTAPEKPATEAPKDAPELGSLDPAALEANADEKYALVPSPAETQAALMSAGIEMQLAELVPERAYKLDENDADRVAVRTGVVLADMLLTVKTSSDEKLLAQLDQIKMGMSELDGGTDVDATLNDTVDRIKAGTVTRDELLNEFDELSNVVIPEFEFNGVARVVPLIQAGSWLNGANLVARACKAKETPSAADSVLKQPSVVGYFQKYAKQKASAEGVPSVVADALDSTLASLKTVAGKSEPLTGADIDAVISSTNTVLALL